MNVSLSEPISPGLTYVSDDSALVGWGCALTAPPSTVINSYCGITDCRGSEISQRMFR